MFVIFLFQLLFAQDYKNLYEDLEPLYTQLVEDYKEQEQRLKDRDEIIAVMNENLVTAKQISDNMDEVFENSDLLKGLYNDLIEKYEQIVQKSIDIEGKYRESLNLATQSTKDLKEQVIDLNKLYNQSVKDCTKPWYARLETYIAVAAGFFGGWLAFEAF